MGLWKQKLKEFFVKKESGEKRKTENLIVFLIILIITVICINIIWKDDETEELLPRDNNIKLAQSSDIKQEENINIQENNLETRLEDILKKMNGIEDVEVLITYSETNQVVPMYNEKQTETVTTEGDNVSKKELDTSKEVVFEESGSTKSPVLQSTILPKMEGAVITAKGAENAQTKANIIEAVQAATGLSANKIQVFEMK